MLKSRESRHAPLVNTFFLRAPSWVKPFFSSTLMAALFSGLRVYEEGYFLVAVSEAVR